MKAKIFLSYYGYNDDKFSMDEYYKDSNDYINTLNNYSTQESNFLSTASKEENEEYASCDIDLYDDEYKDMTIDKLVGMYNNEDLVMMIVDCDLDSSDEDFDGQLNEWFIEHQQLQRTRIKDEEKMALEPKRDIKMVFKNLSGKDTYCTLYQSMILEKMSISKYIILVSKIIFTTQF